jgi:hypothetical protein
MPGEPREMVAWRHRVANRWLRTHKAVARSLARPQTRSRESSSRRRSSEQSSRSADGGDPHRLAEYVARRGRRALRRARRWA